MDENFIFKQISNYINIYYLLTFIFLSYLVKQYFRIMVTNFVNMFLYYIKIYIFRKKISEWNNRQVPMVHVVIIIATLLAIPYLLFGADWQKILLSYTVGTSLHEVIFEFIEKKLNIKNK